MTYVRSSTRALVVARGPIGLREHFALSGCAYTERCRAIRPGIWTGNWQALGAPAIHARGVHKALIAIATGGSVLGHGADAGASIFVTYARLAI